MALTHKHITTTPYCTVQYHTIPYQTIPYHHHNILYHISCTYSLDSVSAFIRAHLKLFIQSTCMNLLIIWIIITIADSVPQLHALHIFAFRACRYAYDNGICTKRSNHTYMCVDSVMLHSVFAIVYAPVCVCCLVDCNFKRDWCKFAISMLILRAKISTMELMKWIIYKCTQEWTGQSHSKFEANDRDRLRQKQWKTWRHKDTAKQSKDTTSQKIHSLTQRLDTSKYLTSTEYYR